MSNSTHSLPHAAWQTDAALRTTSADSLNTHGAASYSTPSSPELKKWVQDMQGLRSDLRSQWDSHFSEAEEKTARTSLPRWLFQFGGKMGEHAGAAVNAGRQISAQIGDFAQRHPWGLVGGALLVGPLLKPALSWLLYGTRSRWLSQGAFAFGVVQLRKQMNRMLSSSVQGWLDRALAFGLDSARSTSYQAAKSH